MDKLWLSETDKEVECFHPVCAQALREAMALIGLDKDYQVEHHRYVGSLEMDLVISNKATNKILCVIEVKRTIPAVYSSRYQYQAMSYVQSLRDSEKESNYYILTNLECSCMFRYSPQRQNVYDQLLQPGIIHNHRFENVSEEVFRRDLALQYREFLLKIIAKNADYVLSFSEFAKSVKESIPYLLKWNTSLAFMFYEYIRGSFNEIGRKELYDIKHFRDDIFAICKEAARINFNGIFGLPQSEYDGKYRPMQKQLSELYKLGKNYRDADAICNIMHQVISSGHTHEGEVPTDIELAQTLVSIVKNFVPELGADENITDPAAGSGTLLSAAAASCSGLIPSQIQANDINKKLLQLLTLRMGLCFASTINRNSSPIISTQDIADIDKSFFEKTRIIVLNPPYLSAISNGCVDRKNKLADRIWQLTGKPSQTNAGQAPLECPFIELITHLVKPGTIIACIIPNTHLSALGAAEVAFRKFLLEEFGLSLIFNYPQTNLFEDVAQNTSIFVGQAHQPQKSIKFIQSLSLVSELNQDDIAIAIDNLQETPNPEELVDGMVGNLVPLRLLREKVADGWMFLDAVIGDVYSFVNKHINTNKIFTNIENGGYGKRRRGKVGNFGGSNLLYISTKEKLFQEVQSEIAQFLCAGMRNSDYNNYLVGTGDQLFFNAACADDSIVKNVIAKYLAHEEDISKQKKMQKPVDEWLKILRKESKNYVPANTVLLPRASRKYASTYVTTQDTYLSTNFVAIFTNSEKEAKVLASWMCSIFYQLQLEIVCKNQNGMRKLEIGNINRTLVPIFSKMNDKDINTIIDTEITDFYDLKSPAIREIDRVWAKIITQNSNVDFLLDSALRYLTVLAKNRES